MINKVILIGNLGKDPEVKHLDGGSAVANFSIATSERYTNKKGEKVAETEWHNLELWGKQAEIAEKYLTKGSKIYVEGKLKTDSYEKDGVTQYRTKVRVLTFTMLDSKGSTGAGEKSTAATSDEGDDDLPF